MGMDQTVVFAADRTPGWPALRDLLAARGVPAPLRMIDGELALPDEEPPPAWRELRVGMPMGMVTLRRTSRGIQLVTWGNADAEMRREWNLVTWAVAKLSDGKVETPASEMSADDFARDAGLSS